MAYPRFTALAWFAPFALVATLCAGCPSPASPVDAGDTDATPTDASTPDVATDATPDATTAWDAGAHDPFPQVPNNGGPTIAHPALVVVSFADDTDQADHEADARWIVTSDWLRAVGPEYGIGTGTVLGTVHRTENAPDATTDAEVQQLIADGITAGTIPRPAGGDLSQTLYVVYYPHHTTLTHPHDGTTVTETSCVDFGAYHSMAHQGGLDFAYAVVAGCSNLVPPLTQRQHAQLYLAHELFEAATDPDPLGHPGYLIPPSTTAPSPWAALLGNELADLCELDPEYLTQDGFVVARVWSNAAAMIGRDNPCVPQDPTKPYFNMSASPSLIQAHAGELTTVTLRGWSNGPVPAWTVSSSNSRGTFTPALMVRTAMLNNGMTTQLGVTIPAGTPVGSYALLAVIADGGMLGAFGWPIVVIVQ